MNKQNGSISPQPPIEVEGSRQLPSWLLEHEVSLAFTTYQSGKLFLIGTNPDGDLSLFERTFNRCMGLWSDGQAMWLSTRFQLWRFENALAEGTTQNGYDRLYLPQVAYTTGDIDVHDIAVDSDGRVIFVNTLFSCLATVSDTHSFEAIWKPRFISRLAAEDRCHLNGLAMRNGRPAYVTSVSMSDIGDGWRDNRESGGCLLDVASGEPIVTGMSMPHSPRWYRDELYILDSGNGILGKVDLDAGRIEPITVCPGYARGLSFHGDFAIVGLSLPRDNKTFAGLALDRVLSEKMAEPRCGLLVVDLRTGDVVHWLRLGGQLSELYDVVVLPDVRRPMAIGLKTDEICRTLHVKDSITAGA